MAKKADRNQGLFMAAARTCGLLVQPIHEVGQGVPDLIVSGGARTGGDVEMLLVELKCNDWIIPPSDPRWLDTLTPDEQAWHRLWRFRAPVIITNRVGWVLDRFGWSDDEIRRVLAPIAEAPAVRAALRKIEQDGDGTVPPEVRATIEWG